MSAQPPAAPTSRPWMSGLEPSDSDSAGRLDTSVAHPARVYGYWLGGKDYFPADRRTAEDVIRLRPQVVASARANRAFLARVVRYLAADCRIRQFLDIGTGLPAPEVGDPFGEPADLHGGVARIPGRARPGSWA
jgi:S-adenosyl methyltransferase